MKLASKCQSKVGTYNYLFSFVYLSITAYWNRAFLTLGVTAGAGNTVLIFQIALLPRINVAIPAYWDGAFFTIGGATRARFA